MTAVTGTRVPTPASVDTSVGHIKQPSRFPIYLVVGSGGTSVDHPLARPAHQLVPGADFDPGERMVDGIRGDLRLGHLDDLELHDWSSSRGSATPSPTPWR